MYKIGNFINFSYLIGGKKYDCKMTIRKPVGDSWSTKVTLNIGIELPIEMMEYVKELLGVAELAQGANYVLTYDYSENGKRI